MANKWCIGASRVGDDPRIIDAETGAYVASVCDEDTAEEIVDEHNSAVKKDEFKAW